MNSDRDEGPNWGRMSAIVVIALVGGAAAMALFPEPHPPEGEGTVSWTDSNKSNPKGGRQSVAWVELADGRSVLAVFPASAGPCQEGSRVTLVKDGTRSVIAPNSCAPR
jgi:hypothetical protein